MGVKIIIEIRCPNCHALAKVLNGETNMASCFCTPRFETAPFKVGVIYRRDGGYAEFKGKTDGWWHDLDDKEFQLLKSKEVSPMTISRPQALWRLE